MSVLFIGSGVECCQEMTKELVDSGKSISINEIRLLYLRGLLAWETYQHFEDALSHNFSREKKSFVVAPLTKETEVNI